LDVFCPVVIVLGINSWIESLGDCGDSPRRLPGFFLGPEARGLGGTHPEGVGATPPPSLGEGGSRGTQKIVVRKKIHHEKGPKKSSARDRP